MGRNWQRVAVAFLAGLAVAGITTGAIDLGRDKYDVDTAHSSISFSVGFMGLSKVEGRFGRYEGTVLYDEADITRSSATVMIRAGSIWTGSDFRDNHLRSAEFFDAEKFPFITFQSQRVVKQGEGFVLIGPLTMHGVTREVAVACKQIHPRTTSDMWGNPRVGFEARVSVNRKDFGVGNSPRWERTLETGAATIGNDVEIRLFISARALNYDRISGGPESIDAKLWKTFEEKGFEAMAAQYKELNEAQAAPATEPGRREGGVNTVGYKLLWRGKVKEAVQVFEWNLAAFPKSANAYDGLADAQARAGMRAEALANFRKSLEMDANNPHAMEMVRFLEKQ